MQCIFQAMVGDNFLCLGKIKKQESLTQRKVFLTFRWKSYSGSKKVMVCLYISLEYKLLILLPFLKNVFTFQCTGSWLLHVGFLWLWRVGAILSCGAWASHCDGFSYCRASVCEFGPSGCGAWAKLPCSVWTQGSFWTRLNLCPLHWQVDAQPLDHWGPSPFSPKSNHQALNIFCVPASVVGLRRWW